jgi:hypothetical protein
MAKRQSAGELSRTIAGQWSKSEKRSVATRAIMEANKRTHQINKKFQQQLRMK